MGQAEGSIQWTRDLKATPPTSTQMEYVRRSGAPSMPRITVLGSLFHDFTVTVNSLHLHYRSIGHLPSRASVSRCLDAPAVHWQTGAPRPTSLGLSTRDDATRPQKEEVSRHRRPACGPLWDGVSTSQYRQGLRPQGKGLSSTLCIRVSRCTFPLLRGISFLTASSADVFLPAPLGSLSPGSRLRASGP